MILDQDFQKAMSTLGVDDSSKYLLYPPSGYKDYRNPVNSLTKGLEVCELESSVVIKVKVCNPPQVAKTGRGPRRITCRVTDGLQTATLSVFGNIGPWMSALKVGEYIVVSAKIEYWNQYLQLKNPELIPALITGRIVSKYRAKEGLISSDQIESSFRKLVNSGLLDTTVMQVMSHFSGFEEKAILNRIGSSFKSVAAIIRNLHVPENREMLIAACQDARRLNALSMLAKARSGEKNEMPGAEIVINDNQVVDFIRDLPFPPTSDQSQAIKEICHDLKSPVPMDRLLSGDVGCGKTLSYSVPAAAAQKAGSQVVVFLPNSLLASQVASEIKDMFPDIPVELVMGGGSRPEDLSKKPIIVGTSAIVWWLKDLRKERPSFDVDFLIIDEQQKVGSKQKEVLVSPHTNVLEASATAIPRTVALVNYGGKSMSRVEKCPVDKTIVSRIVEPVNKTRAGDYLLDVVSKGYQIAVVYPLKERGDEFRAISVADKEESEVVKAYLKKAGIKQAGRFLSETPSGNPQLRLRVSDKNLSTYNEVIKKRKLIEVVPFITEKEAMALNKNVEESKDWWETKVPGGVVTIHGGMSNEDKELAMERAKSGDAQVIVTTSVIEIGLTMPDLRGLLVANAEKYGASTLHQLRGRLARKGGHGAFFMSVDQPLQEMQEDSVNRLKIVSENNNGRLLAELDMKQRGFGDISSDGEQQSGFLDGIFKGLKATVQDVDDVVKIKKEKTPILKMEVSM